MQEEQKPIKDLTPADLIHYNTHVDSLRGGSSRRSRPWRSARSSTSLGSSSSGYSSRLSSGPRHAASTRKPSSRQQSHSRTARIGGAQSTRGPNGSYYLTADAHLTSVLHSMAVRPEDYAIAIGAALAQQGGALKMLVKPWEREEWWAAWPLRGRCAAAGVVESQSLTRAEFRMGVRAILGAKEFGSTSAFAASSALARLARAVTDGHIDSLFQLLRETDDGADGVRRGQQASIVVAGAAQAPPGEIDGESIELVTARRIVRQMKWLRRCALRAFEAVKVRREFSSCGANSTGTGAVVIRGTDMDDGSGASDTNVDGMVGEGPLAPDFRAMMRETMQRGENGSNAEVHARSRKKAEVLAKAEAEKQKREEELHRHRREEAAREAKEDEARARVAAEQRRKLDEVELRLLEARRMMSTAVPPARFASAAAANAFFRMPRVAASRRSSAGAGGGARGGAASDNSPPQCVWLGNNAAIALTRYAAAKGKGGGSTPQTSSGSSSETSSSCRSSTSSSSSSGRSRSGGAEWRAVSPHRGGMPPPGASVPSPMVRNQAHLATVREALGPLEC